MLSDKKIKGLSPDEFIQTLHTVCKWLEVFAEAGEDIYGEDYPVVLAFVGLPLPALVDAMEAVAMRGDEMVARMKNKKASEIAEKNAKKSTDDLIKGLGIKLEGKDDAKPS